MPKTVELVYRNGVLVNECEKKNGDPHNWGRNEVPDRGYVVVRIICALKAIPSKYLQRAYGTSRYLLDEDLMSEEEKTLFKDKARFKHMNHRKKHTITLPRFKALLVDNQEEWEATLAAAERE